MADSLDELLNVAENQLNARNAFSFDSNFIAKIPDMIQNGDEDEWMKTSSALHVG
jgi:hypothetical protein